MTRHEFDQADLTYVALAAAPSGAQDERRDSSNRRGAMEQQMSAAAVEGAGHEEPSMPRPAPGIS